MRSFLSFAIAAVLLMASCTKDVDSLNAGGESLKVTFTADIPIQTEVVRAGEAEAATLLTYVVYDNNTPKTKLVDGTLEVQGKSARLDLDLIKGETYNIAFWAQAPDGAPFEFDMETATIKADYSNAVASTEALDAFYAVVTDFTVSGTISQYITLKRPFAQVNIGVPAEELENAAALGVKVTKAEIAVTNVANTLDIFTGEVSGEEDVTFGMAALPTEKLVVNEREYAYLAYAYLFVDKGDNITDSTDLTFQLASDTKSIKEITIPAISYRRNYRTNILGRLITGSASFSISIDDKLTDESYENIWANYGGIYTKEALAGKTIEIPEDWHIRNGYLIEPMPENWTVESTPLYTKSYTIDGKGSTIFFEPESYKFVVKNAFAAADSQLVTVKDISFAGEHFGIFGGVYGGVTGRKDYITVFENVNIINNGIYCYNSAGTIPMSAYSNLGSATLNNCTIKGTYWVGAKDLNENAQPCYDRYGVYDVFVPNNKLTTLNDCEVGTIYVHNNGHLTVAGASTVDKIDAKALVNGTVTIEAGAKVALLNVNQYSARYAPTINIKAGATVETLQLNSIAKISKITIDAGANISKIIYKGVEYTSIEDFKSSL